jgi:E3 ubiquitin-protein ligase RGLG
MFFIFITFVIGYMFWKYCDSRVHQNIDQSPSPYPFFLNLPPPPQFKFDLPKLPEIPWFAPSTTPEEKSKEPKVKDPPTSVFSKIGDNFKRMEDITEALRKEGVESCNLIVGIDFTSSNNTQGMRTFGRYPLHRIGMDFLNPYESVISVIGKTLSHMDDDGVIPCYGFGDSVTQDLECMPILSDCGAFCTGFEEVLTQYRKVACSVKLSGPTNFAPVIRKAIEIVKENLHYHILIIVTDGQVSENNRDDTIDSIVEASNYPLSIIVIGVGDGPFEDMNEFDDELPERRFDNLQFVEYNKVVATARNDWDPDVKFAVQALMEIPEQYAEIKRLGLMNRSRKVK